MKTEKIVEKLTSIPPLLFCILNYSLARNQKHTKKLKLRVFVENYTRCNFLHASAEKQAKCHCCFASSLLSVAVGAD